MRGAQVPILKEYATRRRKLMEHIGSEGVVVLAATPPSLRNRDIYYPYRPSSDFIYLSGFTESDAVMVLAPESSVGEFILFCQPKDATRELWDGSHAGIEGALQQYGADVAYPMSEMNSVLPGILKNRSQLYYDMGEYESFDRNLTHWIHKLRGGQRDGMHGPFEVISLSHILHEMRLFKSRHEIRLMRKVAKLSGAAITRAMRYCRSGGTEMQLEAEILHEYHSNGARATAYPPIVGCAANSCTLHYTDNIGPLLDNHLVLIDAGAELNYYASDITRTFPVNGVFNAEQRAVYEVVLEAQKAAINEVRVGKHWNEPHEAACKVITEGLVELRILKGNPDSLYQQQAYKPYYMHRTGHWIGMDVHDVGEYQLDNVWRMLESGMAMTVEPGLYLRPDCPNLDAKWHNIGIRIEDEVVVTTEEAEVISHNAPKEIDDIEQVMA